jgi:hypothetical protein
MKLNRGSIWYKRVASHSTLREASSHYLSNEEVELGGADKVDLDGVIGRILRDLRNTPRKIRTSSSGNVLSIDSDKVGRGWNVNGCIGGI